MHIGDTITIAPYSSSTEALALAVREGLRNDPKSLPCSLFYDDIGSKLFQKISELPEYYLTAAEHSIIFTYAEDLGIFCDSEPPGRPFRLIELGPGDGRKIFPLLHALLERPCTFTYEPIDISNGAITQLLKSLRAEFDETKLDVRAIVADYFSGLARVNIDRTTRNVIVWLGSSIGNLTDKEADEFLFRLWYNLNHDDVVIIGFDLRKNPAVIRDAYDDPGGVTREFNLNLLRRINRELGADFTPHAFDHRPIYNSKIHAMESWLVNREYRLVTIPTIREKFSFERGEKMLLEISRKYSEEEIEAFALRGGFAIEQTFYDEKRYFADSVWKVVKPHRL